MATIAKTCRSRGFSLLEVLIAVVILSVGLLALATLQMSIIRSSSESKAQIIAINLAQDKLEELTTYRTLNKTANNCTTDTTDSYQCIDSGNDTVSDTLGVFTSAPSGGAYTRTWTVQRCTLVTGSVDCASAVTGDPATGNARNEFKSVQVTVAWTDAAGGAQGVSVRDAVGTLNPGDSALLSKKPTKFVPRTAKELIYNPASEAGVIPIAVGNNSNSAATNPKPEVIVGNSVVETRFDVLTYSGLVGDTTVTAQSRVETSMVGCTCDFSTAPPAGSSIRGSRPSYWDGTRYIVPFPAEFIPKAGEAAGSAQSTKCSVCCRDHHDPVGVTGPTFSPLQVVKGSDVVTTSHPHYYTTNGTTWAASTTGLYQESCRLVRSDGIFRAAPDLSNDYFGLLATGDGTTAGTSVPDTTSVDGTPSVTGAVARYQKYVLGYMKGRFIDPTPSAGSAQATYNTVNTSVPVNSAPSTYPIELAATAPYVLDRPASVSVALVNSTGKWLHARGLYIDYLEQDAVDAIATAKADSACTVSATALSTCILKLLPFTTINLTEVADWTSGDADRMAVTNYDFSTSLGSSDPVRGKVTTSAATAASPVKATSYSRKSNTGLLDLSFNSTSTADDVKATSAQAFNITGGPIGGTKYVTVNLVLPNPYSITSNCSLPVSTPNTPAVTYLQQSAPSTTYACNAPSPANGSMAKVGGTCYRTLTMSCPIQSPGTSSLAVANGLGIQAKIYNYQAPGTSNTNISCSYDGFNGTNGTGGLNLPATKPYSATYNTNVCYNFAVSGATVSPTSSTGTVLSALSDGNKAESTVVNFSLLKENDTVTINYNGNPTSTNVAPSCSYRCSSLNGGKTDCANPSASNTVFNVGTPGNCP